MADIDTTERSAGMKRYSIRIPNEIASGAQLLTEIEGTSINQLVIDLLAERIEKVRKDPKQRAKIEQHLEVLKQQYGLR
jgi:hypothetical protein